MLLKNQELQGADEAISRLGTAENLMNSDRSKDNAELVFKTSPALDSLRIPSEKPVLRTAVLQQAARPTSRRLPLILVALAALGTTAFLAYGAIVKPGGGSGNHPQMAANAAQDKSSLSTEEEGTATGSEGVAPAVVAGTTEDSIADLTPTTAAEADGGAANEGATSADGGSAAVVESKSPPSAKRLGHRQRAAERRRVRARAAAATAALRRAEKEKAEKGKKTENSQNEPHKSDPKEKKSPSALVTGDGLDSLIEDAIGPEAEKANKKTPASKPEVEVESKKQLGSEEIKAGMRAIRGAVQACYDKYQVEGMVNVRLTIGKDGRPVLVKIRGKFFGTDTGSCVASAVQNARFPSHSGDPLTINYPFRLAE